MSINTMTRRGLFFSIATIIAWAFVDVSIRLSVVHYQVDAVIFTCLMLFVSSGVLILAAGPGKGGISTLKSISTWQFSFFEVIMNVSQLFALVYITTTEMMFLNRMTIVMAFIMMWIFFSKKPTKIDFIALIVITLALMGIAADLPSDVRAPALFAIFWVAFASTVRTFIAEKHPDSNKAYTIKDQCRVAGYVLLVTSIAFLLLYLFAAVAREGASAEVIANFPLFEMLPTYSDFMHKPTLFTAILIGVLIFPWETYLYFMAAKTAKTDNFMIITAFAPFVTLSLEGLCSYFGLLDISEISGSDIMYGAIVTAAAFVMAWNRREPKNTTKKPKQSAQVLAIHE